MATDHRYVFLSYSSRNYEAALKLKELLNQNNIDCWMAPGSIPAGSNYAAQIPAAIRDCSAFLLLLTAEAQSSYWVPKELDRAINEKRTVIPFQLDDAELSDSFGFTLCNVQRIMAHGRYEEACEELLREIGWMAEQRSAVAQPSALLLNLPLRTAMNEKHFMGRETELAEIAKRFETERVVVLSGLGGMGKTELAVRFARQYDGGQTYFVGFRGDFYHTVTDGIALGVEGLVEQRPDEAAKFREAMKVLSQCSKTDLLIIDNADTEEASFEQLRRDLSVLPMRILITTRCDAVDRIDVNALRRKELHRIFRLYNESITVADMDALIDAVDAHTLTVDLMARSMRHGRRAATAEKLLTALNSRDLSSPSFMQIATNYPGGLRQARINEHLRTVFQVAKLSEDEKDLLRCATLLPADGMSDELFMRPFAEEMQDILDGLIQKGWLLWENDLLKIHPVICIVCREELKPTEETCGDFMEGVFDWYDKKKYDHAKFRQLAELLEGASDTLGDPDGWYIVRAGYLCLCIGESRQGLKCNLRAMELREQSQPDSWNLATTYNNVGGTYGALGDHNKALEYNLKALEIWKKTLPSTHPSLALSYNNLGSTYGALGDHNKALECKLKALEIWERSCRRTILTLRPPATMWAVPTATWATTKRHWNMS